MKRSMQTLCAAAALIGLTLGEAPVSAQPGRGPDDPRFERPGRERPDRNRGGWRADEDPAGRRGPGGQQHVERWLLQLQGDDPDEYERLTGLRDSDPAAFRVELRRRLHEVRVMKRIEVEHPGFHEYLTTLSREERDRLGRFLRDLSLEGQPEGFRHRRLPYPAWSQADHIQALVMRWQAAPDDSEDRAQIEAALREQLERIFDQRTAEQENAVREAEEHLRRLRDILDRREAQRGAWVDQVMKDLVQGKQPDWRDDGPKAEPPDKD